MAAKKAAKKKAVKHTVQSLGAEAKSLIENEVLSLALDYAESRALIECRTAKDAEQAWRGTLRAQAVQDVRATLHAYIAQGEADADRVSREREDLRVQSEEEKILENYLAAARIARDESDTLMNGKTKGRH